MNEDQMVPIGDGPSEVVRWCQCGNELLPHEHEYEECDVCRGVETPGALTLCSTPG